VTERDSHWSEPVEFTVSEPNAPTPQQLGLRVTEIMYNAPADSAFEYIELRNISGETIDLRGVELREAVEFEFRGSAVEALEPGEYVVVVEDLSVFSRRYDANAILVAGQYRGQLANSSDRVVLAYGAAESILDFSYDDTWYETTDGQGLSLIIVDDRAPVESWAWPMSWRPSNALFGSPGVDDSGPQSGLQFAGNVDQDSSLSISDAVSLLRFLFSGDARALPCADGSLEHPSNQAILDVDGGGRVGIDDAVFLLNYLFRSGPEPALGRDCVLLAECPNRCGG
jgi:hypothetical protein